MLLVFPLPFPYRELLPKDFTVYTYNKEGKLQSERPDVQVGFPSYTPAEGDRAAPRVRVLGL